MTGTIHSFARLGRMFATLAFAALAFAGGQSPARADGGDDSFRDGLLGKTPGTYRSRSGSDEQTPRGRRSKGVQVASLGDTFFSAPSKPSVSGGGGVRWVASSGCLNPTLQGVVAGVAAYGTVTVSSTCRSHAHNASVGGAPKSLHLTGDAVDFRVSGDVAGAYAYLRSAGLGGLKHYGGGLFHADTGPKRSW